MARKYAWSCVPSIGHNGHLVLEDTILLPPSTHALHYGGSVIEGIIATTGPKGRNIFRLHDHLARLFRSMVSYGMGSPLEFDLDELVRACVEVLTQNPEDNYLRPIVFRGPGNLGVDPTRATICAVVMSRKFEGYLGEFQHNDGVIIGVSNWRRPELDQMPPGKGTALYIPGQRIKIDARAAGQAEQLIMGPEGDIAEASGQNLFMVDDGELITPTLSTGALPGITRETVMLIAREREIPVAERSLTVQDLLGADEVFLCGSLSGIVPVTVIEHLMVQHEIGHNRGTSTPGYAGGITRLLRAEYTKLLTGETTLGLDWLTPVLSTVQTP